MLDRRGGARASIHGNESLFFSRAPSGRDPGQCKNKTEVPSQARRQHARTRARGRTNQLVRDSTREADWSRPTPAPHRIQTHRLLSPLATCNDAEPACPGLRPMIPIPAGPLPACAALTTKLWSEACDPIRAARRGGTRPGTDELASKRPLVVSLMKTTPVPPPKPIRAAARGARRCVPLISSGLPADRRPVTS